jgi:hypothetical protein
VFVDFEKTPAPRAQLFTTSRSRNNAPNISRL